MSTEIDFTQLFSLVPPTLLVKVNGDTSESSFRNTGGEIAIGIDKALPAEKRFSTRRNILDFGSGLGRVSMYFLRAAPLATVTGFDIDPAMVHWSRHLLSNPRIQFVSSTLPLASGSFDLITSVSVFTHLDTTTEFWLSEIHRLLSDDGMAVLTYQDETLFEELKKQGQIPAAAQCEDKFVTGKGGPEGGANMGTFYTTRHWERLLSRFFNVHALTPRGLFGHQSLSVVSRKPDAVVERERLVLEYASSLEREIFELRRDHGIGY